MTRPDDLLEDVEVRDLGVIYEILKQRTHDEQRRMIGWLSARTNSDLIMKLRADVAAEKKATP